MRIKVLTHGTQVTIIKKQHSGHYFIKQFDLSEFVPQTWKAVKTDEAVKMARLTDRKQLRELFK